MTDAKPAYDFSAEFERACNALLLEVDASIVDDVRARGRAAIGAKAARVKALEDALRTAHKALDYYAMDWTPHDDGIRARGVLPVIETALGQAFDGI